MKRAILINRFIAFFGLALVFGTPDALADGKSCHCLDAVKKLTQELQQRNTGTLRSSDADFATKIRGFGGNAVVDDLRLLKQSRKEVGQQGLVLLRLSGDTEPGLAALSRTPDRVRIFADIPETAKDVKAIYGESLPIDPTVLSAMKKEKKTLTDQCGDLLLYRTSSELLSAESLPKGAGTIAEQIQNASETQNHLVVVVAHVDGKGLARFRDGSSLPVHTLPRNIWMIGCNTMKYDAKATGLRLTTIGKPDFAGGLRAATSVAKAFKNTAAPAEAVSLRQALVGLQNQKIHFAVGALGIMFFTGIADDEDRKN